MFSAPTIYPIVDVEACARAGLDPLSFAEACLRGGAAVLQLRSETGGSAAFLDLARRVVEENRAAGSALTPRRIARRTKAGTRAPAGGGLSFSCSADSSTSSGCSPTNTGTP